MKVSSPVLTILVLSGGYGTTVTGFTTPHINTSFHHPTRTTLDAAKKSEDDVGLSLAKFCTTAAMTAFLWGSPPMIAQQASTHNFPLLNGNAIQQMTVASARDKASATGSRVNKDPYSLLRLSLPIKNKEVCVTYCGSLLLAKSCRICTALSVAKFADPQYADVCSHRAKTGLFLSFTYTGLKQPFVFVFSV
jgi:hypothetical protein